MFGGEAHLIGSDGSRILVNGGWQDSYPAIEIYEVDGEATPAVTAPTSPVVVGGPEDLLDLADLGLLSEQPTRARCRPEPDQPDPDAG